MPGAYYITRLLLLILPDTFLSTQPSSPPALPVPEIPAVSKLAAGPLEYN